MEPVFSLSPRTITSVWPRPLLALLIKVQVYRFLWECVYVHVRAWGRVPAILSTCSSNPITALLLWGPVVLPSARPTPHLKTPSTHKNCISHIHIYVSTHETKVQNIHNWNASKHILLHLPKMWCVCVASELTYYHHPGLLAVITLAPWALVTLTKPSMLCSDNQSVKREAMLAPAGLHVASLGITNPLITYSSSLYSLNCSHITTNLHLNAFCSPFMAAGKPTKDQLKTQITFRCIIDFRLHW